jgi:hypothetical protein
MDTLGTSTDQRDRSGIVMRGGSCWGTENDGSDNEKERVKMLE